MKVSTPLATDSIADVARSAIRLEALGFDQASYHDLDHDAFLPLAAASAHTASISYATHIAVGFARTPMNLAILANDLQIMTGGRFTLGMGTQIKAHITRRFDMPWSHPARRMGEMIEAIKAIWTAWETGEKLSFQGEFYSNTLMTPTFTPKPHGFGRPKIYLAAVGPLMTETVATVADGLLPHGFSNEKYFREVTLPAVDRGLAKSGRTRDDFHLEAPGFVVTGSNEESFLADKERIRRRISFYGSTPAYRPAFEVHGWGELGDELHRLSVSDDPHKWDVMATLISDEVLDKFAVCGRPAEIAPRVLERYGDAVDGVSVNLPHITDDDVHTILESFHGAYPEGLTRTVAG